MKLIRKKLIVAQLPKKFPAFYETRSFVTVFTRARHWTQSSPHPRNITD